VVAPGRVGDVDGLGLLVEFGKEFGANPERTGTGDGLAGSNLLRRRRKNVFVVLDIFTQRRQEIAPILQHDLLSSQPHFIITKTRQGHPQERERRKKPKQTRKKGVRKARAKNAIGIKEKEEEERKTVLIHPHSGDYCRSINSLIIHDPGNRSSIPPGVPFLRGSIVSSSKAQSSIFHDCNPNQPITNSQLSTITAPNDLSFDHLQLKGSGLLHLKAEASVLVEEVPIRTSHLFNTALRWQTWRCWNHKPAQQRPW